MASVQEKIAYIEKRTMEAVGPIGKFVVSKKIKALGFTKDDFPPEQLSTLLREVMDNAIVDTTKRENLYNNIKGTMDRM